MAGYTYANLTTDIRNYTEVDDGVLTTGILNTMIKNSENKIYRESDSDDNRFYATSNLAAGVFVPKPINPSLLNIDFDAV